MGNYRFRLFVMISNSWFCKHKFMDRANGSQSIQQAMKKSQTSATTTASAATLPPIPQHKEQDYLPSRASYYIPSKERREKLPHSPINNMDPQPPRKSKPRTRRKDRRLCDNSVSSATSVSCTCHHTLASVCKIGSTPENGNDLNKPVVAKFDSFHVSSSMTNININMTGSSDSFEKVEDLEVVSELKLPPILTKPVKKKVHKSVLHDTTVLKEHNKIAARRSSPGIRRVKVWQSSPRIGGRNVHASRNQNAARPKVAVQQRRALSESLVVTKSSLNPRRDFTESMVEMIVQNNIREMKDLEDLLACYLSLNSKEYHEVIIKVFERIWFVLNDIRI